MTEMNYLIRLRRFCEDENLTPEDVVKLAKEGKLESVFDGWVAKNKARGISQVSINCVVSAVRSFLKSQRVEIDYRLKKGYSKPRKLPTKEELKRLFDAAPLRVRAFLYVLRDTGLAPSDVLKLRYKDVQKDLEGGIVPVAISINRGKTGIPFTTFLGKEAVDCLKLYLDERRNKGEVIKPESYLFTVKWKKKEGKPLSIYSVSWEIYEIRKKIGLLDFEPYDLRRYFATNLRASGLDSIYVEYFMGHNLGVNNGYFLPNIEDLREKYRAHYNVLSFTEDIESLKEKLRKLSDEREELLRKINKLESEQKSIMKLLVDLKEGKNRKRSKRESDKDIERALKQI
jgi:integrase/recombinase XerD